MECPDSTVTRPDFRMPEDSGFDKSHTGEGQVQKREKPHQVGSSVQTETGG